jgi:uncharacterized damage-inducible protein DinB
MAATRTQLISTLSQTYPTLVHLTAALPDSALDYRLDDAWTIREILAHLVDDEMYVMRTRFERILKEEQPALAPHDEKKWYASRNKTRDALNELLADFQTQRAASLGIMAMLRESDWARQGYQPEYGMFTAEEWLKHWADHDTTHIQQIESLLRSYTGSQTGRQAK